MRTGRGRSRAAGRVAPRVGASLSDKARAIDRGLRTGGCACSSRAGRLTGQFALETFKRAFAEEIRDGTIEMDAIVSGMLMTKIRQGNMAAIFWYMRSRMGWKDTADVEKRVNELQAIVRRGARGAQESQFASRAV